MRAEYLELQALGQMCEAADDEIRVQRFVEVIDALPAPDTQVEIESILKTFPSGGDTYFGVAWTLLHTLEASPLWLQLAEQYRPHDEQDEWLGTLQRRIANAHRLSDS